MTEEQEIERKASDSGNVSVRPADVKTVTAALEVLKGQDRKSWMGRLSPFLGPAFIAAVAYMDPGNFATNIQSGSEFGYLLLWVVFVCNLMAMLIQSMSAKLGIATGKNLAEMCRDRFSPWAVRSMWVLMELVAIATDLAEFLGAALGFQLLFHIPLLWGAILTAIATFAGLALERYGFRPLEATISALLGVVAVCYFIENVLNVPDWSSLAYHAVVPQFSGSESVLLAAGILGATVMPHAIFLHSALTQDRVVAHGTTMRKRLFQYEMKDILVAMGAAGFVNAAVLVMGAATFHSHGMTQVADLDVAYKTLEPLLGRAASWIFAIALIASGLSSSIVGTMSGQVIMQGFLHRQIPVWIRRVVTIAPSIAVVLLGLDVTRTLVVSQVLLSFALPFAIIPLIMFTRRRDLMGELANSRLTNTLSYVVTALIVGLNVYLIYRTIMGD